MRQNIKEIKESGKIVVLSDSSEWEVDMFDRMDTRFWMRLDNVSVSGDKMTNHSQRDKTVSVKRRK